MRIRMLKQCVPVVGALTLAAFQSQATVVWVGGSSMDFWDDSNWDFSGSTYDGSTFNPLNPIMDNIFMANATGISVTTDQGIRIGNSYNLTLDASDLYVNGSGANSGINGVDDDPLVNPSSGVSSFLFLKNGSFLNTQFTSLGMDVNIDGTSHMQYRGSGDPINGQSERTVVNLSAGGRLTLPTLAEFTEQATTQNSDILIEGVSFGIDNTRLVFSGSGPVTGVAVVPEPSFAALSGLALLGLLLRRRTDR